MSVWTELRATIDSNNQATKNSTMANPLMPGPALPATPSITMLSVAIMLFYAMNSVAFVHPPPTRTIGGMRAPARFHSKYYDGESRSNRPSLLMLSCASGGDGIIASTTNLPLKENATHPREQTMKYIAKTVESFKLADLYWLESCVAAYCQHGAMAMQQQFSLAAEDELTQTMESGDAVRRLAFHRPTASYLLGYYHVNNDVPDEPCDFDEEITRTMDRNLPFRSSRFQYAARVIASGQTPHELLKSIKDGFIVGTEPWVLEYDTFEPLRNPKHPKKSFSPTMLTCAVSRVLPGEPLLTSANAHQQQGDVTAYVIVETATSLYLVEKISHGADTFDGNDGSNVQLGSTHTIAKQFRTSWSRRPFQYSGAINLDVALTVIDILKDVIQRNNDDAKRTIRILDPTCGSGTFLALALMAWGGDLGVEATGIDSNSKCAHGTMQNLRHLFSIDDEEGLRECNDGGNSWTVTLDSNNTSSSMATIHSEDSTRLSTFVSEKKFDCAVANLPWNRNTFEFQGNDNSDDECTNSAILKATAAVLKPGSPLVVVSGGQHDEEQIGDNDESNEPAFNARTCLENLGFEVLGEATIPPKGFQLPASGKKRDSGSTGKKKKSSRSSDCVITVAVAP